MARRARSSSLLVLLLAATWMGFPLWMLVATAGLRTIPRSVHEAAAIEGAGRWRTFTRSHAAAAAAAARGRVRRPRRGRVQPVLPVLHPRSCRSRRRRSRRSASTSSTRGPGPGLYSVSAAINIVTLVALLFVVVWFLRWRSRRRERWRSDEVPAMTPHDAARAPRPPAVPRRRRGVRPAPDLGARRSWRPTARSSATRAASTRSRSQPTLDRFVDAFFRPGAVLDYWGLLRNSLLVSISAAARRAVPRRDDGVRVRADAVPGQGRGAGRDPPRRVPAADRPRGAAVPPVQRDRAQRPARERVRAAGLAARALDPLRVVRDAALPVAHARGVPGGARGARGGRVRRRRHALDDVPADHAAARVAVDPRRGARRVPARATRSSRSPGCSSRPTRT